MIQGDQLNTSHLKLLRRLWPHIPARFRSRLALLLLVMILVPFFEIASIGSLLPLLGALIASDGNSTHPVAMSISSTLGIDYSVELLALVFGIAALTAGAIRLLMLWLNVRVSFAIGAEITNSIYNNVLNQPYSVHIARNSSEIINAISNKSHLVIHNAIMPVLALISAALMAIVILGTLLFIDPFAIGASVGGLCFVYSIVILLTRKRLNRDGALIAKEGTNAIKAVQEGLGGIRDILMDGTQSTYSRIYRNIDKRLRWAQGNTTIIAQGARLVIETFGILLIVGIVYVLSQQPSGLVNALPVLGVLVLGIQRLLPVLQGAYVAWITMQNGQASVVDALDLLELEYEKSSQIQPFQPISFGSAIVFDNIWFRYHADTPWVLRYLNFVINKGDRIGFVGQTGSGKSTLLDLFMGLLDPSEGAIEIDGHPLTPLNRRAWQGHIAHVPQFIYLSDSSIEENVAFGVPKEEINHHLVKECCRQAQISDTIEAWPNRYLTRVGERGVRMSGGQRQRIGIARALYKQTDIIIFDEATSALDNETEDAVIKAIEGLNENLTILIIAHRLTTLKMCSKVIVLQDGGVSRVVSPDALMAQA